MASIGVIIDGKNVEFADNGKKIVGGGTGTDDYEQLENKPSINGVTLQGDKTAEELGLVQQADIINIQATL